jgi:cytochrome o ubiquinol oxidase subunit 2
MLNQAAYTALERQSQNVKPFTYGGIDPALFQMVTTQKIAPAPGPQPEDPVHSGREVSTGGKD